MVDFGKFDNDKNKRKIKEELLQNLLQSEEVIPWIKNEILLLNPL